MLPIYFLTPHVKIGLYIIYIGNLENGEEIL